MAGKTLNQPIVGLAATPDAGGYWLVAADGGIFTFGNAQFYGSTGSVRLNQPIVGMAATPDGRGYWLVAADGGIFAFGSAQFYGSTGSIHLNKPVVGMATDGATGGYWLVASDGGVFAFRAPFLGSMGGSALNAPIAFVTGTADFGGYRLVGSDGGVFDFGDAQYFGSAAAPGSNGWHALAATPDGGGYWLFATVGSGTGVTIDAFGNANSSMSLVAGDASGSPVVGAASLALVTPPTITLQPVSQTVNAGTTVTFSAAATGSPQPSVQWQASGDHWASFAALHGSTSDTLTFPTFQYENGLEFRAMYSNAAGSVASAAAVLRVIPAGDVFPSSSGGYFLDVSCASTSACVAVGGTQSGFALIERSVDGGSTFTTSPVPPTAPPMVSVDCNDVLHCVAVGPSSAMYSSDGGFTWTTETVPVPVVPPGSGATISYSLMGVACASDTICTAVGEEVFSVGLSFAIYIHSIDGGQTWSNSTAQGGSNNVSVSVTCSASSCVSVGQGAYRSTDGGATWQLEPGGFGVLLDVACTTDESSCLAVGPNPGGIGVPPTTAGGLDISTNQGQSWTPSSSNLPQSTANIEIVSCGGPTDCMVVSPPAATGGSLIVITTVDSGGHWTSLSGPSGFVSVPGTTVLSRPFPEVACTTPANCTAAGASSSGPVVEMTGNAGQSWVSATLQ